MYERGQRYIWITLNAIFLSFFFIFDYRTEQYTLIWKILNQLTYIEGLLLYLYRDKSVNISYFVFNNYLTIEILLIVLIGKMKPNYSNPHQ